MKALSKLEISPAPWKRVVEGIEEYVIDRNGFTILEPNAELMSGDISLAAAAPELYQRLHEATYERCSHCPHFSHDGRQKCLGVEVDCHIKTWQAALDRAAGLLLESEVVE